MGAMPREAARLAISAQAVPLTRPPTAMAGHRSRPASTLHQPLAWPVLVLDSDRAATATPGRA